MPSHSPVIVWFRNDLRVGDHRALSAAVVSGAPVIAVFILDDVTPGRWKAGGASRWWLHHSLAALAADLQGRGCALVLRQGDAREELPRLVSQTGAQAVYFSRAYEPYAIAIEQTLKEEFDARGVGFKRYGGALLQEPEETRTKAGAAYSVYTPFWRALSAKLTVAAPKPAPRTILPPAALPNSLELADLALLPRKPDWAGGMREAWTPGEAGAHKRLDLFIKSAMRAYASDRNRPDVEGTSRLSPHLHFGEITPSLCWYKASQAAARSGEFDTGLQTFLKELVWREFSYQLLVDRPDMPQSPLRAEFSGFPWVSNAKLLKAWQSGQTGYPIVDAGMRELWQTGYMHNRVRMITASFLVKDLRLAWQAGEDWFWDTLVDADLANNAASWQWVAGCGADAAPYFRIFNPTKQGETFDPDGRYVRRYVPELGKLPSQYLHAPWLAPREVLEQAGITLGKTYPRPVVDHATARRAALASYETLKASRLPADRAD